MRDSKTVMLTGAGGAATGFLIERLKTHGFRVLAGDMDPRAVGLYLADKGFVIPAGKSPRFFESLARICAEERVDAIVPLVDEELEAACGLEEQGVVVLLPRLSFVATCLDKYALMRQLAAADIGVPATRLASEGAQGMRFPLVVKPRTGRGSRGLALAESRAALERVLAESAYSRDQLLIQEHVAEPEYTVSVVVWRDGRVQAVVPKEIICKRGITRLAVTRRNLLIEQACHKIQTALRADGPFNVQLRLDEVTKQPKIFEINPRFSTTVTLTLAAGIDEVGGLIIQALRGSEHHRFGHWQEGVVLLRRTLDQTISEEEFFRRSAAIVGADELN